MRIIVQKFGGTSVSTPAVRECLARHVASALADGWRVVVVVSAMGREGDEYSTDTLLKQAQMAGTPTPRDLDLIASCGEVIAAVVVASALRAQGIAAVPLTGGQAGIVTDGRHSRATVLKVDVMRLKDLLEQGHVAVVCGFQGVSTTGEVTTLGRGGSDTTAAALGAALGADVVDIFTDVDGVMTADPRLVPGARPLPVATYHEMFQMAQHGAKVIHPAAVEISMRGNVPLRVRATAGKGEGTLITNEAASSSLRPEVRPERAITGVTHLTGIAQVRVRPSRQQSGVDLALFTSLADAGVSVDLINVSPDLKSFTVKAEELPTAVQVLQGLSVNVSTQPKCAKVSVVGVGMRGVPGVMANVVSALHGAGVEILQTADSHLSISCLIHADDTVRAVRALHEQFGLDADR